MEVFTIVFSGLFTGIGVIAGQWFFERFMKHRLEKMTGGIRMVKFCKKCGIRIKEGGFQELIGNKAYDEFEDGIYCLDCADARLREKRKA